MRMINTMLGTFLLLYYSVACMAEPPVLLTKDENSYWDLTAESSSINLLDCLLRVEGASPNFILVHGKGEAKIPLLAVKSIQDDAFIEVAIHENLFGLKINRMLIRYYETRSSFIRTLDQPNTFKDKVLPQSDHFFLVEGDLPSVERELSKHFPEKEIHNLQKIIVLLSRPDMEIVGGYGYEPWFGKRNMSQVEYHCTFE